ncbi:MAG: ferritin family protein [Thermodesulfobacteriota bacterium]|nr:ferritin family protein [Thermodesulfobacteriota bacterium]
MRSKAAAQLLLAEDFAHIYNMSGGIIAYDGGKAVGNEEFGMEFFVSGDFNDVFRMGYAMEEGLQQLYLVLKDICDDSEVKDLLERLARFEEGHKAMLEAKFPDVEIAETVSPDTLEGGFDKQRIIDHFNSRTATLDDIIQLGMMLETQAFDLYNRLAAKENDPESKEFFTFMANEERHHLGFLSREYDRVLS